MTAQRTSVRPLDENDFPKSNSAARSRPGPTSRSTPLGFASCSPGRANSVTFRRKPVICWQPKRDQAVRVENSPHRGEANAGALHRLGVTNRCGSSGGQTSTSGPLLLDASCSRRKNDRPVERSIGSAEALEIVGF